LVAGALAGLQKQLPKLAIFDPDRAAEVQALMDGVHTSEIIAAQQFEIGLLASGITAAQAEDEETEFVATNLDLYRGRST
jgi:hypothetical protein